jgi:hypothetical protein
MASPIPPGFDTWEQCRDYYALDAIFLGQLYDRRPGPHNRKRYSEAARLATAANRRCKEPIDDE